MVKPYPTKGKRQEGDANCLLSLARSRLRKKNKKKHALSMLHRTNAALVAATSSHRCGIPKAPCTSLTAGCGGTEPSDSSADADTITDRCAVGHLRRTSESESAPRPPESAAPRPCCRRHVYGESRRAQPDRVAALASPRRPPTAGSVRCNSSWGAGARTLIIASCSMPMASKAAPPHRRQHALINNFKSVLIII